MSASDLSVFGAGSWGCALAAAAARAGANVTIWGRDAAAMAAAEESRRPARRPEWRAPEAITFTADIAQAAAAPVWILAVPAQTTRALATALRPFADDATIMLCAAKGIERETGRLQTEILSETFGRGIFGALSGPGFADDVVAGLPFAATLATDDPATTERLADLLRSDAFRPYVSADVVGVQCGGALKNVYAVACGAAIGAGLGESARAGLIARSFAEMRRLAGAMGAQGETLTGLSGLGDLVLTATSERSRNYALGETLGRGATLDQALGAAKGVTEGVTTARAVVALGEKHGVETPIAGATEGVISGNMSVVEAGAALFARPLKREGA